jgi:hypothetical protein
MRRSLSWLSYDFTSAKPWPSTTESVKKGVGFRMHGQFTGNASREHRHSLSKPFPAFAAFALHESTTLYFQQLQLYQPEALHLPSPDPRRK